ncbi:MAG: hypothetical protein K2X48_18450 [Chitinophagaceae bacterium]|nr:hypothetical protein [Chitinophagaceae bacterium]
MQKLRSKRFWFITLALQLMVSGLFAQLSHFVYLQSDNGQPFYIKYNSKIISSTSSGYIILSKLNDGIVEFSVGFPQSQQPEQKFQVKIDKTEKGYLIKNFADKGWGLFDLQTAAIVYAATSQSLPATNQTTAVKPADDPFANMLSNVTQDSTVKTVTVKKEEKPVVIDTPKVIPQAVVQNPPVKINPPQKQEPVIPKTDTPKKEEVIVSKPPVDSPKTQPQAVQQPVIQEPVFTAPPKSPVNQLRRFNSREGSDWVFEVVEANGMRDTVRLFIAADSSAVNNIIQESKQEPKDEKKDTVAVTPLPQSPVQIIPEVKKEETKPQETQPTAQVKKEEIKPEIKTETTTKPASIPNSNCKEEANDDDFLKLRKKMAAQSKEEAMVTEAKKVFKTKCFSTAQLKNLAVLFLTDEWRYRFYDAALPFVTDFNSFKSLAGTITDDYYKKRFLALLPNQ